jgi:transcriptional regulator with XRE-family HTH domain
MEDDLYRVFGSRVRALREERKVTQDELAKRVDLSRTSITNIEKGRQRVLLHQMVEIAQALEADPGALVPRPGSAGPAAAPKLRDDVARVVDLIRREGARGE